MCWKLVFYRHDKNMVLERTVFYRHDKNMDFATIKIWSWKGRFFIATIKIWILAPGFYRHDNSMVFGKPVFYRHDKNMVFGKPGFYRHDKNRNSGILPFCLIVSVSDGKQPRKNQQKSFCSGEMCSKLMASPADSAPSHVYSSPKTLNRNEKKTRLVRHVFDDCRECF